MGIILDLSEAAFMNDVWFLLMIQTYFDKTKTAKDL